jgi:hypothetical protein
MSHFRSLSAILLSALTSFSLVTASCGTNAVGVDECRDVERARCRAGDPCGIIDDVAACERYYRDHCLHGLATKPPSNAVVGACVQVINDAGQCASADPETKLADCDPVFATRRRGLLETACDVVAHPEFTPECSFLLDTPPVEGTGGQGGQPSDDDDAAAGQGGVSSG